MKAGTVLLVLLTLLVAASALAAPQQRPGGKGGLVKPNWWGPPPGQKPAANGTVAEVSSTQIVLDTKQGRKTFAVTPDTKVWVRGKAGSITDVKVGDPCRVVFKPVANGTPIARRIVIPKPHAAGQLTAKEGNVLTLKNKDTIWTVTVLPEAKIRCWKYEGTLADLRIGYRVVAFGEINGNNVVAELVQFMPMAYKGAVTEVNVNQITVKTIRQKIVTGVVTDKTTILVRPRVGPTKPGTLADIKVGAPVNIGGHVVEGGPMQLIFVHVLTGA